MYLRSVKHCRHECIKIVTCVSFNAIGWNSTFVVCQFFDTGKFHKKYALIEVVGTDYFIAMVRHLFQLQTFFTALLLLKKC